MKTVHIKTRHKNSHLLIVLFCLVDISKLKSMAILLIKPMLNCNFSNGVFLHIHKKGWQDKNGATLWIRNVLQKHRVALNPESILVWACSDGSNG
ncbi:hypothetical protein X975_17899, partial [Stegodyphus mimosarum]